MNDVTILTPLPTAVDAPVLMRGAELDEQGFPFVPRELFDRRVTTVDTTVVSSSALLSAERYEQLHLVPVRFDLCERDRPGACALDEPASLRLVFQPFYSLVNVPDAAPLAVDAALNAF